MASGQTTRLHLPYPLETDSPDVAADMQSLANALDHVAITSQDTLANRPAAAAAGRLHMVQGDGTSANNGIAWWDTGTGWIAINPVDAAPGTASLRTLGTGAQQAMPGNATPTPGGAAGGDLAGTYPNPTLAIDRLRMPTVSNPARSVGTVYQPSAARPTLVTAVIAVTKSNASNGGIDLYCDTQTPPRTGAAQHRGAFIVFNDGVPTFSHTFLVAPGEYYEFVLNGSASAATLTVTEITL